ECGMLVHREHLLGLFVLLLTFYRKGALFSIPFGFYWIINTPEGGSCLMNRLAHHQGIHKFFFTLGLTLQLSKPVIKHLIHIVDA
ncbi:hypothetical protein D9548_16540, partial [Geobacillus stearothermophilus]